MISSDASRQLELSSYPWTGSDLGCAHDYLLPRVRQILDRRFPSAGRDRVLDLGCGNGAVTAWLSERGFDAVGVDPSLQGIERALAAHPDLEFHRASGYDALHGKIGTFPLVVSLEVIEHVYDPPRFARTAFDVLSPGGTLVCYTLPRVAEERGHRPAGPLR